jgi:hypothetical protein
MTDVARVAAIHDFSKYVREKGLSLRDAITALGDPARIKQHIQVGEKFEEIVANAEAGDEGGSSDLRKDVELIRDALNEVIQISGQVANTAGATNKILTNIEKIANTTHNAASRNENILGSVHNAASDLKRDMTLAINATEVIVEKLEAIPARLDAQLQKMERLEHDVGAANTVINNVEQYTHPDKTHKENVTMTRHSIVWGAIASTILGSAATLAITHYLGQGKSESHTETKISEKCPDIPKTFTLHNRSNGQVFTLDVDQGVTQQQDEPTRKDKSPAKPAKQLHH